MRRTKGQDRRPGLATGSGSGPASGSGPRNGKRPRPVDRHRLRPEMLVLEDRRLLSTFQVTNDTTDNGSTTGTLRWAVAQANSASGSSIEFELGTGASTITLTSGQLELTESVTIYDRSGQGPVTVSGNDASRVFQVDGGVTASLTGLTISGGFVNGGGGGGLYNAGTATLTDCTLSGNSARWNGGGGYLNGAGGGLLNVGTATLTDCTLSGNSARYGGGLNNNLGTVTLTGCTISGNSVGNDGSGGGMYSRGGFAFTATLTDCTISGNSADVGGGLENESGTARLTACTVSENLGGGLNTGGTGTMTDTIVAGNTGGDASRWVALSNDLVGGDPLLAPLGYYGGPTETMPLLPGSPALGAGSASTTTDQRGEPLASPPDIGAFQSQGFTLTAVSGSTLQSAGIGAAFAEPLAVTVAANNPVEPVNGGVVSFANAASNGAMAVLATPSAVIAGAQAAILAEPDNADGSYTVVASATGSSSVLFALTNTGPVFTSLAVNMTSDSLFPGTGFLSLPEAVAFANLDFLGISTITFAPTVFASPQTIPLTSGPLVLSNTGEAETITGPAAGVTISGGGMSGVFIVDNGVTASLTGLTISGGSASYGAGLEVKGTVTVTNCAITGNSARVNGGGVANDGTATLTNCTITGNSAGGDGGGVANDGAATLTNCTITGNSAGGNGGGVANIGSTATLINCTISGNDARGDGGGLFNTSTSNYYFEYPYPERVRFDDGTANLNRCTISGNDADGQGGGVANEGVSGVALTDCSITGNSASSGGGLANTQPVPGEPYDSKIYGTASATLTNCTITGNSADNNGGGVANTGGTATVSNCTISGNSAGGAGGGLFNTSCTGYYNSPHIRFTKGKHVYGGEANLSNCTISGNGARSNGGGVANEYASAVTLTNCTITGDSAGSFGGGVEVEPGGTATVTACSITGDSAGTSGGGVEVEPGGTAAVTACSITGDSAGTSGGGMQVESGGDATLINSTLAGNSSPFGGAINDNGTVTLVNCTVADNTASVQAGGLRAYGSATATLTNTIVAENTSTAGPDLYGTVNSLGNNLFGNTSGLTGTVSTDVLNQDPLLAPLGDYGGTAQTIALLPGSPALCTGNITLIPSGVTTDQRGLPRTVDNTVDIGAFESQGFTLTLASGASPQSAQIGEPFANSLAVTVTANNPVEPVNGGVVWFVAQPAANGASAILQGPSAVIAGVRAAILAEPNEVDGSHDVVASVSSLTNVSFALTNTGPVLTNVIVNTTSNLLVPGVGLFSLPEAIALADTIASGNASITFDGTAFNTLKTITLAGAQLELSNTTGTETITGPAAGVVVSGGGNSRVFQIEDGVTASISGLTIIGGSTTGNGGGIANAGVLTVSECTISGDTAGTNGGGISDYGMLNVYNSTISGDSAENGGGIANTGGGTLTVSKSTINSDSAGNDGGGIANTGSLTVSDSTISGDSAGNDGGGIANSGTGSLTVSESTINSNSAGNDGGGIANSGTGSLTVCESTINSNSAGNDGGGIANSGTGSLTVSESTINSNSAGTDGGGIAGAATVSNCTISGDTAGNNGGGISSYHLNAYSSTISGDTAGGSGGGLSNNGTATLADCTVSGDSAADSGGGIFTGVGTSAYLSGSTINDDTAGVGGGIANDFAYNFVLSDCTISGDSAVGPVAFNSGGGIYIDAGYDEDNTLTGCTISGDDAVTDGGGICLSSYRGLGYSSLGYTSPGYVYPELTLMDCTISGNSATGGGGIRMYAFTTAKIVSSTIAGNTARNMGGLWDRGLQSVVLLDDTIIAANFGLSGESDLSGPVFPASSSNLIGVSTSISNGVNGNQVGTAASHIDPLLAPLGDYGGPTQTMPLLPGSPAIGTGDANADPTDERGVAPLPGTVADIGAFESQGFTIAATSGSGQTVPAGNPFAAPLGATVTANDPNVPVSGVVVTFTTSASGASAVLSADTATTDTDGTASIMATANDTAGAYTITAAAPGVAGMASFDLTNGIATAFSGLSSPSIGYGTATVTLSGTILAGAAAPLGDVTITLGSAQQSAPIDVLSGFFSAVFSTSSLNVAGSPYGITYAYSANGGDTEASESLTVTAAPLTVTITGDPTRPYDGTTATTLTSADFILSGLVSGQSFTVTQPAGTYNSPDVALAATVTTILSASNFNAGVGTLASNYTFPTTASGAGSINKANATVVVTPYTVNFDGNPHSATITSITGVNGEAGPTVGTVDVSNTTHTAVGTYSTDSWTFTGAANYNNIAAQTITNIINAVDTTPPTSHIVNNLGTSQSTDSFPVTVSITDPVGSTGAPASGVASVELFVSINNGPFSLNQTVHLSSPQDSGTVAFTFVGQDRNIYAFHSIAIDAAGNTESKNSNTIEASTSVPDLNPPLTHIVATSSYNNNGVFTLNWSGTDPDQNTGTPAGSIALVNIYVEVDSGSPTLIGQLSGGIPNAGGVYSGTLPYDALADGQSHTYRFYSVGVDDQHKQQYAPAGGPTTPDVTFSGITYSSPLAVENLMIEDGIAGRSFIQYLDVDFNQTTSSSPALQALAAGLAGATPNKYVELLWYGENVTASSVPIGVNLFNNGATASVTLNGNDLSINFGANGVTSLLSGGSGSPTKTYGDGWYALGIDPTGNPSNGQVFWEPFFRLLGDTNGDGVVTGPYTTAGTDAATVYHAEGQSGPLLNPDVNGDGAINSKDLSATVAASGHAVGAGPSASVYPAFQLLAGAAGPGNAVPLAQTQVQALLPEAIAAWRAAGLDAAAVRKLKSVRIQVGDLGTSILGLEAANVITINKTAAGNNWYVGKGAPTAGSVDLLTVLEHELGHVIGLSDNDQAGDLMDETLGTGVRRSPTQADLPRVAQASFTGPTSAAVDAALLALVGDRPAGLTAASPQKAPVAHASARHSHDALSSRFPSRFQRAGQASGPGIKPKGSPE
jgi:hypothetical protein